MSTRFRSTEVMQNGHPAPSLYDIRLQSTSSACSVGVPAPLPRWVLTEASYLYLPPRVQVIHSLPHIHHHMIVYRPLDCWKYPCTLALGFLPFNHSVICLPTTCCYLNLILHCYYAIGVQNSQQPKSPKPIFNLSSRFFSILPYDLLKTPSDWVTVAEIPFQSLTWYWPQSLKAKQRLCKSR